MPRPFPIFCQSDNLIHVDSNSNNEWQTVQIQISCFLQKPTDLDLHCLQRQGISGFSRTRVIKHYNDILLCFRRLSESLFFFFSFFFFFCLAQSFFLLFVVFFVCVFFFAWYKSFILFIANKKKSYNFRFPHCKNDCKNYSKIGRAGKFEAGLTSSNFLI